MEYIIVKDGIIMEHLCGCEKPEGAIEVPAGFTGFIGAKLAALKDDFSGIKPISQQVQEGILTIPEGFKANKDDNELVRMAQEEIDEAFPPEVWAVPGEFHGITVHKTFDRDGNFGYNAPSGAVKMQEVQPSSDYKAQTDGTWVFDIDKGKSSKISEINAAYNVSTSALVSTYPETEVLTFDKQEKEARSWDADNTVATPFLDGLALARGIDKAELVRRVIAKSDAFQTAVATLTGLRQRYEDQLSMATTAEEVAAIIPVYDI